MSYYNQRFSSDTQITLQKVSVYDDTVLSVLTARWEIKDQIISGRLTSPRHTTLRRKGRSFEYPRAIDKNQQMYGKLAVYMNQIRLLPSDDSGEVYIDAELIKQRIFYRDIAEIHCLDNKLYIIEASADDIELFDVLTQAYL